MVLDITEIEYFFTVLELYKVKYFFFPFSTFSFIQNFYSFHLQLLVIVVPTKLSTMSGLEKVHVQVTGVAVSQAQSSLAITIH